MHSLSKYLSQVKIDNRQGHKKVKCHIRKKWYVLTPEEIVRQCAVLHCIDLGYPSSRISVEKKIQFNNLSRRYDIVVYNKNGTPHILIECKAMHLPIHQSTLDQATAYNKALESTILWLSNGHDNLIFRVEKEGLGLKSLKSIPRYSLPTYLEEE